MGTITELNRETANSDLEIRLQSSFSKFCCRSCSWLPQDASGDPPLFPRSTRLCSWCSVICCVLALWAHFFYGYVDGRPDTAVQHHTVVWFSFFAATIGFGCLTHEMFIAIAIFLMGMSARYQEELIFRRRLRLNRKMISSFIFVLSCYYAVAFNLGMVHRCWLAAYYGQEQIVYGSQFLVVVIAAPMVMGIHGQMEHTSEGVPRNGVIPSALLTSMLQILRWQGLVVKSYYVAWILICFSFVCYFVASAQQLLFAWMIKNEGCAGKLRAWFILYLVLVMGNYGIVYLLGIPGWMRPEFQNMFYCVADASLMMWTCCVVCATNDVAGNDELRRSALAVAADLARIIQTASVPIFGVDVDVNINEWNIKTALLTGISKEGAMGTPLIRMIGVDRQEEFESMVRQALAGDEKLGCLETYFFPQDREDTGKDKAMLMLSAAPTKDRLGRVQGVTFVGCDLTEVTAFREADARKVRFMAIVSHELRSPLHGIIGLMDYFTDGEQDSKKVRYIKMVQNCATRLLDLVVDIMEIASVVSTNPKKQSLKLSHDPVELNKIMDEILVLVKNSYDTSGTRALLSDSVQIINNMGPLPIIEADAHKCTQVLFNILANACKFTVQGFITISSQIDPEGEWVEVIISDTGIGIEAAALARIFKPFEQASTSTASGCVGIGLGLSIALEVVKSHGGRILVESQVGVGSTFTVRLPMVMSDGTLIWSEVSRGDEDSLSPGPPLRDVAKVNVLPPSSVYSKKPLLLSVDDDQVNQEVVRHILGDMCEVRAAMDGERAIEYLRSAVELPDLVLLDVMMPGLSGFDVCKFVRKELGVSETRLPILMLSASTLGTTVSEALQCGANSYVYKPFDKPSLIAHVQSALRINSLYKMERADASATASRLTFFPSYSSDQGAG